MQTPSTREGAETADGNPRKKQCARLDKEEPCLDCQHKDTCCATCGRSLCPCQSPPNYVQVSESLYCIGECVPERYHVMVMCSLSNQLSVRDEKLENARDVLRARFASIENLEQQLATANQTIEELKKAAPVCVTCESTTRMCCVCMEQRADIACAPCGHLSYCQKCTKHATCPQCRTTPTSHVRVYI